VRVDGGRETSLKVNAFAGLITLALVAQRGSGAPFLPLMSERWSTGLLTGVGLSMLAALYGSSPIPSVELIALHRPDAALHQGSP